MKRSTTAALACSAIAAVMSGHMYAQTSRVTREPAGDRLPVTRVVLYKSGVGYFEHLGRVRGNQTTTIAFTSGQLDDVLKSLTALDLDGGRVSGISYNSEASVDRRLGALRVPVGDAPSRAQFLAALKGARIEVRSGAVRSIGRLLSVERVDQRTGNVITPTDALTLVSDSGELRTIALTPNTSVRLIEAAVTQEVGRYLSVLASARDQDVRRLSIATSGSGDRDLFVSYISEVPVWKATYRLVLPGPDETRRPLLQGWAIVDNTAGEDWDNVQLSLVAGAPQSFIQRISQPYYVQRPIVPLPDRMMLSPQTHQSSVGTAGAGAIAGTVSDGVGVVPGATVVLTRSGLQAGSTTTDGAGRFRFASVAPGNYDVAISMEGFRPITRPIAVSGGMETVTNATLQTGGRTETVNVDSVSEAVMGGGRGGGGQGFGRGFGGGVPAPSASPVAAPPGVRVDRAIMAQSTVADPSQLGDLFEYALKDRVTIRKNQSALVPIVSGELEAEKVSLWNGTTGSSRPLRAIWMKNSTGLTLDAGSLAVIEGQAFSGEGLMESLKPGERRLLSYALDLGVVVDSRAENVPSRSTRVRIANGVIIQETEDRQRRAYTARNENTDARVLLLEHPVRTGWTLDATDTPAETTPSWYRFRVTVAPKTTVSFVVQETRPAQRTFMIDALNEDQVALLVRDAAITPAIETGLRAVIARKGDLARVAGEIDARQRDIDTIGRDQERVRENMKSLKGSREEKQLLQRYVKDLDEAETRLKALRADVQRLTADRQRIQDDVKRMIEGLSS